MSIASAPTAQEDTIPANLRPLYFNGVYSQGMESLTTGALLVGLALHLGASNVVIGVIASIPFLANLFQLPAIFLVDHLRDRKKIVVVSSVIGRGTLLTVAAVPFIGVNQTSLTILITAMAVRYSFGAFTSCAWNSWMRDIIPPPVLGRFMGQRMFLMTVVAVMVGLAAAAAIDFWHTEQDRLNVYGVIYVTGSFLGLVGAWYSSRIPDVAMEPGEIRAMGRTIRWDRLRSPFHNRNFRRLMAFLCSWNFAANLATPFFTVYMLTWLGYELTFVIMLTLFSQAVTAMSLKVWGRYADRFSHKAVMGFCCSVFLLCFLGWTFTTFPERHAYTTPLLFLLHALMGIATAGVNLTTNSLAFKLAPQREATSFLAVNSMLNSLAAGIAPLLGGLFADYFATRQFSVLVRWQAEGGRQLDLNTLSLGHWDFFFCLAFFIGLYALHRLSLVKEDGHRAQALMIRELLTDTSQVLRSFASVDGMRDLVTGPIIMAYNLIKTQPARPQTTTSPGAEPAAPPPT